MNNFLDLFHLSQQTSLIRSSHCDAKKKATQGRKEKTISKVLGKVGLKGKRVRDPSYNTSPMELSSMGMNH